MSQLVPSAGNQPTAVKDSGQYTMQQLSETVRCTVTSPTLIIHNITLIVSNITREKANITINGIRRQEIIIKNNQHIYAECHSQSSLLTRSDS